MSKSKDLTNEINKIVSLRPVMAAEETTRLIKAALEKSFNDGVEQTIMANNKKTFTMPTYKD